MSSISVTGPFNPQGPGNTASREKIFVCTPKVKRDEPACAKEILSSLARIAYRRPVADEDIRPLLSLFETGKDQYGSFEAGIQMAIEGLLVNIDFLFRLESDPRNVAEDSNYELNDLELASRLSFFPVEQHPR